MPAPVVGGLINYLVAQLGIVVWDGEVPRQNTDGTDITPTDALGWPAVKVEMSEAGLTREQTFEAAYSDDGEGDTLAIYCWATTREALEGDPTTPGAPLGLLTKIEQLLNVQENIQAINLGTAPNGAPYFFYKFMLRRWTCVQEKEARAQLSQLLYRGEWHIECGVHGEMPTRLTG